MQACKRAALALKHSARQHTAAMARQGRGFRDHWDYADKIQEQLGADSVRFELAGDTFKTGRPRYRAVYTIAIDDDEDEVVLDAMLMTSKAGKVYYYVAKPRAWDLPQNRRVDGEAPPEEESDLERLYFGAD